MNGLLLQKFETVLYLHYKTMITPYFDIGIEIEIELSLYQYF